MKTLLRELLPKDYFYYRSSTRVFYEYFKKYTYYKIEKIDELFNFLTSYFILPGIRGVFIEKIDFQITKEKLRELNIGKCLVFRTPLRETKKPDGWLRIPTFITKFFILHSSRSAFSVLSQEDYWNKWSKSARGHRKKIIENINSGKIVVEKSKNLDLFLKLYKGSDIKDPNKWVVHNITKKLFKDTTTSYDIFIIYVDKKPLAGAVFINDGIVSEYRASFYTNESKQYHLGLAMMDAWFSNSLKNGIKYCDLDHMRDSFQRTSYIGYTKFKESVADYDVYFHDTWVKFF